MKPKPPKLWGAAGDPFPGYIRRRRLEEGWTQRQLAEKAGVKSAAYINMIEKGSRVPDTEVAEGIARALGGGADLFRAWVRLSKGGAGDQTREDLERLRQFVEGLGHLADGIRPSVNWDRGPSGTGDLSQTWAAFCMAEPPPGSRMKIPILPEGEDPGDGPEPRFEPLDWFPLERLLAMTAQADSLAIIRKLVRPFAYVLTTHAARFAQDQLRPTYLAIFSRDWDDTLHPHDVYAVRHRGIVLLLPGRLLLADEDILHQGETGLELQSLGVQSLPDLRDSVIAVMAAEAQTATVRWVRGG